VPVTWAPKREIKIRPVAAGLESAVRKHRGLGFGGLWCTLHESQKSRVVQNPLTFFLSYTHNHKRNYNTAGPGEERGPNQGRHVRRRRDAAGGHDHDPAGPPLGDGAGATLPLRADRPDDDDDHRAGRKMGDAWEQHHNTTHKPLLPLFALRPHSPIPSCVFGCVIDQYVNKRIFFTDTTNSYLKCILQ
jgi:hypothetical protein